VEEEHEDEDRRRIDLSIKPAGRTTMPSKHRCLHCIDPPQHLTSATRLVHPLTHLYPPPLLSA
jgi:hypothetical protein